MFKPFYVFVAATALCFAGTSHANNPTQPNKTTQVLGNTVQPYAMNRSSQSWSSKRWHFRYGGPSETAFFFHRRGVNLYETENLDDAEIAFKASLRAQGNSLRKNTLLYLAHISKEKGDMEQAEKYAYDYFKLTKQIN